MQGIVLRGEEKALACFIAMNTCPAGTWAVAEQEDNHTCPGMPSETNRSGSPSHKTTRARVRGLRHGKVQVNSRLSIGQLPFLPAANVGNNDKS